MLLPCYYFPFPLSISHNPQSVIFLSSPIPIIPSPSSQLLQPPSPNKCLMVGRPCGQLQGFSMLPMCRTTFSICSSVNVFPTITLPLQALLANKRRTLLGLGTSCPTWSDNIARSSSRSEGVKVTSRLIGRLSNLHLCPTGVVPEVSMLTIKPLAVKSAEWERIVSSSIAVRMREWGWTRR